MDVVTWYIVLATGTVVAAVALRVAARRTPLPKTGDPVGAIEVAYLNGGAPLAVLAALAALRADGLVEGLEGRQVRATGEVAADREPLERVVHAVAQKENARIYTMHGRAKVVAVLDAVQERLAIVGLLDEAEPPPATRRAWWAPAATALFGIVGVLTGFVEGTDVGPVALVATLVALVAAVFALAPTRRARTRAAEAVLARLRHEHAHLAPQANPSWSTYGADGAALGVALFGEAALWTAEPTFATAILTGPLAGTRPRRTRREDGAFLWSYSGWGGGTGCGGGGSSCGGGGCGGGGG